MSITCLTCPSLLNKDEASEFFNITAAGPMCARYGWMLGANDDVAEAAASKYGASCSMHGLPAPTTEIKGNNFGSLFTPRPDLLAVTPKTELDSCATCVNFDQSNHACAARGTFIFPERIAKENVDCLWAASDGTAMGFTAMTHAKVGETLPHLTGTMVSITTKATQPAPDPAPASPPKAKRRSTKWPRDYDTDAPVQEELEHMIRAYRRVDTRKGAVYLPIFRTEFFGDRADLIPDPAKSGSTDPSLYVDHAKLLHDFAVKTYTLDQNLVLVGEPGTGKSDGVVYLAWMLNMPFERLPYTESSEPDQFLGSYQYDPAQGTYFKPGLLPIAWEKEGVLLSDEINLPPEAISQTYRSMNDSSRVLVVYDRKFKRNDYCFHIGAMNPAHDFRNIGAKPLASADSSRMVFMKMPNPSPDMIRKILTSTVESLDQEVPDPFMISTIIKIGEDLRQASRDGKLPDFWTLRQEVKVARMVPYYGLTGAYAAAYLDYCDQNTKELCEEFIRSHMPSGPDWAF